MQDILLGRSSLPGRASEQKKLIMLHCNNDEKHDLPKVVTQEVLDGAVNFFKDRLITQAKWRHSDLIRYFGFESRKKMWHMLKTTYMKWDS